MTKHTKDYVVLIHQNIRCLAGKTDELNCSTVSKNINPRLTCLSEHHMSDLKLSYSNIQNYVLGTMYSHTTHKGGGVCIYIRSYVKFIAINLEEYCDEKNIEIFALKIMVAKTNILVLCIYKSPCGNFEYFISRLVKALKSLYKPKTEFIKCDFNLNLLKETARKTQLVLLFKSYNIFHTVQFPTRITEKNISAIDDIFIDNVRRNSSKVISISNGLPDQDAQCLILKNINNLQKQKMQRNTIWIVNKESIAQFQNKLFNEKYVSI
jgi:hypothetical protein